MINWTPFELHTHTNHSDGSHTLMELSKSAKEAGFKGIALTDHNTMSGLMNREDVMKQTGIYIIRGLEWTTFYGHVLILGINKYVDWRELGPKDIYKAVKEVKEQGCLVGTAHPFRVGSPMCTGCHWEYEVKDWSIIDYIEVWSGKFPSVKSFNKRAFNFWTDLLNQGYRIAATSGRDWHHAEEPCKTLSATYLAIDDGNNNAIEAIRKGRLSVSMGPLLVMNAVSVKSNKCWAIGDNVSNLDKEEELEIKVSLDKRARAGQWKLKEQVLKIIINSNLGKLTELAIPYDKSEAALKLNTSGLLWIRSELHGVFCEEDTMIAFTNPIYFR
jgi:hypothetical protein